MLPEPASQRALTAQKKITIIIHITTGNPSPEGLHVRDDSCARIVHNMHIWEKVGVT